MKVRVPTKDRGSRVHPKADVRRRYVLDLSDEEFEAAVEALEAGITRMGIFWPKAARRALAARDQLEAQAKAKGGGK